MAETFVLNSNGNLDKLSCHSYNPKVLHLINKLKKTGNTLSGICEKITYGSGKWELRTTDYVPENFPNAIKLLQISNISEEGEIINTDRDKYISKELHNRWKVSQAKKGDLIIAITGTLGRIALFNQDYEANLNQALGIIRLKKEFEGINIIPEFVHLYLNSYYATEQFNRLGGFRASQSGLSLDEIGSVFIILPNEKEQRDIIHKLADIRKEAINHFSEYLKYSKESGDIFLELLNIHFPSEERKIFILNGEMSDRIDAIYNSPFLNKLLNNIKKSKYDILTNLLEDVDNKFHFSDFYNLIDLDNIDEHIGEIRSWEEVKILNSAKTVFKKNNILISKLGGENGNIIMINEKYDGFLGSGELVPFKLRESSPVSLEYLFYVLRSPYLLKQIEYSLSGCSRMRVSTKEMKNLIIPLPENKTKESEILIKVRKLREKALFERKQYGLKKKEVYDKFKQLLEKYL